MVGLHFIGVSSVKNCWAGGGGGSVVCSKMTCFRRVCYFTKQHNVKQTICYTVVK